MRKLFYSLALVLLSQYSFGQAVKDNAVIPVSITLNSILRLTVQSGGNIEFVVNTIDQYTSGIPNSAQHTTKFSVSSSRVFNVTMGAEDATFIGIENGGPMDLDFVRYTITKDDPLHAGILPAAMPAALIAIYDGLGAYTPATILSTADAGGNLTYNIEWELGTDPANTLLDADLPADIYVTNVYLNLTN